MKRDIMLCKRYISSNNTNCAKILEFGKIK